MNSPKEDNNSVDENSVGCDGAAFRTTSASSEVTLPTATEPASILPGSTDGQPLLHSLSQVKQYNPIVSASKANNSVAERSSADDEVALPITSAACELNSPTTTEPSSILPRSTDDGQSLLDFLSQVEEYNPTIPDQVTAYHLNTSGFAASDHRIIRLISLAAQKFVSDVANDAFHRCKLRGAGQSIQNSKDERYVMTMEDLGPALTQYGINANKPRYFT